MGLSYATRFKGFVATVVLSGFFFFLSFSVGLPVIVFRPHKFALCFTLGSLMFMSSFALLKGPMAHLRSICSRDRLQFTSAYLGSMALTLYSALIVRSYILVIITSIFVPRVVVHRHSHRDYAGCDWLVPLLVPRGLLWRQL